MIDAPVSGGQTGAINADLSIMVGGHTDDFTAAQPALNAFGTSVIRVGPSGTGQTVKAANQLIVAGNLALLAEAILFLAAHGVDEVKRSSSLPQPSKPALGPPTPDSEPTSTRNTTESNMADYQ